MQWYSKDMRALYLRQSLDTSGEEVAVSRQRSECMAWSEVHGWSIEAEYVDNDRSASKGARPEYRRLLADIESGKVTGVLAWDLDRLHRQPVELEHFIELADKRHLALATVSGETDLSTDQGRLVARLKGAVARAEIERKSARHKAANRQAAAAGTLQPKIRPFGWLKTVTDKGVHYNSVDPVESQAIKSAAEGIISGTRSAGAVIKEWNESGPATSKGGKWSNDSFRKMMARPRNAGLQLHNGKVVGDAVCEPIISREQFDQLQNIFSSRVKQVHPTGRTHPFSGIPVCGECGGRMYVSQVKTGGKVYLNYLCKSCQNNSISKTVLDRIILTTVAFRLSDTYSAVRVLGQQATMEALTSARDELSQIESEARQIMAADIALSDRLELLSQIKDKRVAAETRVQSLQNGNRIAGLLDNLVRKAGPYTVGDAPRVIRERFIALSVADQNLITQELLKIRIDKSSRKGKLTVDETEKRIHIGE